MQISQLQNVYIVYKQLGASIEALKTNEARNIFADFALQCFAGLVTSGASKKEVPTSLKFIQDQDYIGLLSCIHIGEHVQLGTGQAHGPLSVHNTKLIIESGSPMAVLPNLVTRTYPTMLLDWTY